MKSLLYKSQLQFILCTVIIFTLATPVFYFLTEHYYAEDLIEITNAIKQNKPRYLHSIWKKMYFRE